MNRGELVPAKTLPSLFSAGVNGTIDPTSITFLGRIEGVGIAGSATALKSHGGALVMADGSRRRIAASSRHRSRPLVERFEERLLLTVYTVTSALDSGPGTLRQAIQSVNNDFTPDTIDFAIGTGPQRILLRSALPAITNQVTIDGTTQPGYSRIDKIPQIVIDGSQTNNTSQNGLSIEASGTVVQGLAIINSGDAGIYVQANNVAIDANEIGVDPILSSVAPNGGDGIALFLASNNIIGGPGEGNLIAGNKSNGISASFLSLNNLIQGNAIGTTPPKTSGGSGISLAPQNIGNDGDGIVLTAVSGNTIGGTATGTGNTISGNAGRGINIEGGSTTLIEGNTIGLDAAGVTITANNKDGILLATSTDNTIGGTTNGAGNLISSNTGNGIFANGGSGLLVEGNRIGTDTTGELIKGNGASGILLQGSPSNTIGGSTSAAGNLISANASDGISLQSASSTQNLIQGNTIGIDLAGSKPLGNETGGILLTNAPGNTIGGTTSGAGNIVAANQGDGIDLAGSTASNNLIQGNTVGTNPAKATNSRFGNAANGIDIQGSANNTIGGSTTGAGNLLVLNQLDGVAIAGAGATGNLIVGNHVGTDLAGDGSLGNFHAGIGIDGASRNTIGGTATADANVLVSSGTDGIDIQSNTTGTPSSASANLVEGNEIGLTISASGSQITLPNSSDGILIVAPGNTVGGTVGGSSNVISGNNSNGITVGSSTASVAANGNLIEDNIIGLDATGSRPMGNGRDGVQLIGAGQTLVSGNVISGNANGLEILGSNVNPGQTLGDSITGNIIGLGADGLTLSATGQATSLKNSSNGIIVENGASGVTIGGPVPGQGNVISGNGSSGIDFSSAATGDLVEGNLIGVARDGLTARGNNQSGLFLSDGSTGITVGGTTPGAGNVISGNSVGITLTNAGTSGNFVEGNTIGLGGDGSTEVGNLSYGLLLLDGVTANTIGGSSISARNVISANGQGIGIVGPNSNANVVAGNFVGLDATGTMSRGNLQLGLYLNGASNNTIGGPAAGSGNVISGNTGIGVLIFGPQSSENVVSGNLIGLNASGSSTSGSNGATLGNSGFGIQVENAPSNTIGGSAPGTGNVISGNRQGGVDINGALAAFNVVAGNTIGLDANGTVALGNLADGIQVVNAPANVIGGTSATTRNVISGNTANGVEIDGSGAFEDAVLGNYVGTNAAGLLGLGNGQSGVLVNQAPGVTIGGTIAGLGNLLSGNASNGVQVTGTGSAGTVILGNKIGVDVREVFPIANGNDGVLFDGTTAVTVGGTVGGAGNLISGNLANGVEFGGGNSSADVLQGNLIGTDGTGSTPLANGTGVFINSSIDDLIGGTAPFSGNLISGNTGPGVHVFGLGSLNNAIEGNRIGTNLPGTSPVANQAGVFLDEAPANVVSGNLLSGNASAGVVISGTTASGNLVQGNLIGTDVAGSREIGSGTPQQSGVLINNAPGNVVGGSTGATRNVLSGNIVGVVIAGFDSQGNLVLGNLIGLDASGKHAVPNSTGVYINGSASNTIGGSTAGSTNVISGNAQTGVEIYGTQATGNVVAGNFVGTDATGTYAIRNANGVYLELASSNTIGGATTSAGNLISGNAVTGVYLYGQASDNIVERNRIGVSATGKRLGNLQYGILLYNAANNTAPTTGTAANTIANSGIGNFREFTGSSSTTSKTKSSAKSKAVKIKSVHPAAPKVNRPGSA